MALKGDFEELLAAFKAAGQDHVFKFANRLTEEERAILVSEAKKVDLAEVKLSYEKVLGSKQGGWKKVEPFPLKEVASIEGTTEERKKWEKIGEEKLAGGQVAMLLLAGGQGTRLGSSDPKGCYNVGLISGKSLYQLQAERIFKTQQLIFAKYGKSVILPWYIMTSDATHDPTEQFFEKHNYFGLDKSNVFIFNQDMIPSITPEGKILMAAKNKIAWNPNGNGGVYYSLVRSGALADMKKRGVEFVYQYGVDNIVINMGDPIFVGFVADKKADCASKVVQKESPDEAVGVFALKDGKVGVVEYSEIAKEASHSRDPTSGKLLYNSAHLCINMFTVPFLESLHAGLIYHLAKKKIPTIDENGDPFTPKDINGWKLEMFIFDAFEFAKKMELLEVSRADEFAPLKNATGADSPETCKQALSALHKRWLIKAGAILANESEMCEISPLLSARGEGLEHLKGKTVTLPVELK